MSRSRKILSVMALSALVLTALSGIALAQEKIGVIDPQKVLFQHPKFEQAQKQIKTVVEKKQAEAKDAIDKTSDNNEKQRIFEAKRQEAAREEQKIMEPIFKDIDLAIRTVAKAKGVTIVLDKTQVFFGGADVTEDVIQELKKKNA
ncbi:MAG TPA: OmpH family outer membrane protein [Synergistales bacterium]|nr:OmpH family outer membrane protein [Synergistales bacterium]MDI9392732.1 OmpH family outer membrane protein [Synergistota bacterium]MDY0178665.1 OmpH family outer membrane protein [Synergistaceae bacterium]HRW87837.1 OmpH family outer membrane protein [Thermovirgaceae bacterium]MDD3133411.1 OmpH family outer membrane protein [Synergistales bacterium]